MIRRTDTAQTLAKTDRMDMIRDLPDAEDRGFWDGLPEEVREALITRGEKALTDRIPEITSEDYAEFSRNGNRTRFEEKYFGRRVKLAQLVIAECVEHRGRFLPAILERLQAILAETTWCLPAHNSYERDQAPLSKPDPDRPVIDLFAAETAAILGIAEFLLRNQTSDEISARIDAEIRKRILTPYLTERFWWMGDGEQLLCNWTSWITQNVLLALFTRREDVFPAEELRNALKQAAQSVDYYLDDYSDDGSCSEGIFYYGHSALCLFGCLDVMNRITGNGMAPLWQSDRIRKIAAYPVTMYIGRGQYFNYSDASPYAGPRNARDYLFARYTGNDAYKSFAAADFRSQDLSQRLLEEEENLYCHLLQLLHYGEMADGTAQAVLPADAYYPATGLMTARDEHWALAVKAGNNGDIHNHNDVGSVTLYLDARPILIDLGVGTYTAKTFSDKRYEIWTMQSAYHNTVNFRDADGNWVMQRDGREYAARDVRCGITADDAELSMELSATYGDPRIRSVRRKVKLLRGTDGAAGRVLIRDDFHGDGDLRPVLSFMTYEKPEIMRDSTTNPLTSEAAEREGLERFGSGVSIRIGDLGVLSAAGITEASVEICPIEDERLGVAWKHDCYRILLTVEADMSAVLLTGGKGDM